MSIEQLYKRAEAAIYMADGYSKSRLDKDALDVAGMSALKNRIFLSEICSAPGTRYMEIGVYQGSTFVAALYKNNPEYALAIDNFSLFTEWGNNEEIFLANCKKLGLPKFEFVNSDCWSLDPKFKKKIKNINVYLYDGEHEFEDHRKALTYYYENLADEFIFIVDDWNYVPARDGTFAGFAENNIRVHHQWNLPAEGNGDVANWWNGYYVTICEKRK